MNTELEALRNKLRNDLLGGDGQFVEQIKKLYKQYEPMIKASGVKANIDIDKLTPKEIFDLLSQENLKQYMEPAMKLANLLNIK